MYCSRYNNNEAHLYLLLTNILFTNFIKMKKLLFFIVLVCAGFSATAQSHSVLSQGNWVKVSTDSTGIYRLTYYDLQSMGVDVNNLSSNSLNLYGMAAGSLNETYDTGFIYDLKKIAVLVDDQGDGTFDAGDFLLFYGQGHVTWDFNTESKIFNHATNPYCNKVYYYLRTDDTNPKRIQTVDFSSQSPTDTITQLTYAFLHEKELYNPLRSGRTWMGEKFDDTTERTYHISVPGYQITGGNLQINFGTKTSVQSTIEIFVDNALVDTLKTFVTSYSGIWAYKLQSFNLDLTNVGNEFDLKIVFDKPNDSSFIYLDNFQLNLTSGFVISDLIQTTEIRSPQAYTEGVHFYQFYNTHSCNFVWDVTDPLNVSSMKTNRSGDTLSFVDARSGRQYVMYNYASEYAPKLTSGYKNASYLVGADYLPDPELIGKIDNQDIIGDATPNYIIITNSELYDAAVNLATFHTINDDMTVEVFTTDLIYNEFSAGRLDPGALRNFIAQKFNAETNRGVLQYVLLFGPASFDYRGILYPDITQIPTYETVSSGDLISSYCSDEFITHIGDSFIPVGRIPASTPEEANRVVEKIEAYKTNSRLTIWKNKAVFIADNGDNGYFTQVSDMVSDSLLVNNPNLNQVKLYLSLFPAVNGGYPQVRTNLLSMLNDGVFYVNFIGHGGPLHLTSENIFSVEDAQALTNTNPNPIWVNFSGGTSKYDDPERVSVNMALILNSSGGAIVSIGNSGAGYGSENNLLNIEFVNYFFDASNKNSAFGDAFASAIMHLVSDRKVWTFLGDPALKPSWPVYDVQTIKINGRDAATITDTILPGSLLTLEGNIVDESGTAVDNFNGKVCATVYDMPYIRETIEGEYDPVREVTLYDSILAMNPIDVENGHFLGNVRLPANEHLTYGNIKISYYGQNGMVDASGNWQKLMYGGKPNGIKEDPALASLRVYPSPFTNHLQMLIPDNLTTENLMLNMSDITGRTVYQNHISANGISGNVSLNLPDLPRGLYFLNITANKGNKVFKILRE